MSNNAAEELVLTEAMQTIADASDEELRLVGEASRNSYVMHVTREVLKPGDIEHYGDIDWWQERRDHLVDKFPLTPKLADLAIIAAEATVQSERP